MDVLSLKEVPHEQEGFALAISVPEGEAPRCSSIGCPVHTNIGDFRGPFIDVDGRGASAMPPHIGMKHAEWETSPAEDAVETIFTWIGGSQVRPAVRPAFPYVSARLYVDGTQRLTFPLGVCDSVVAAQDGFRLTIEPQSFQSLSGSAVRYLQPQGVTGIYRLTVPSEHLTAGKPVRLRVELDETDHSHETYFFVSPRKDALLTSLAVLRREVEHLRYDVLQLTKSHEMLYAQVYPQLFPNRIQGERVIALQDDTMHYHPPCVTVMRDGEIVITAREAEDHFDIKGHMVLVRSRDGGRTWSPKELMYDLGNCDHRSAPIFETANGEWVTTDYRSRGEYNELGIYDASFHEPTLWAAWSSDRGHSWQFSEQPLCVPASPSPYSEPERHMIQLPSGRLIVGANFLAADANGEPDRSYDRFGIAVHCSDDNGRTWRVLAMLPWHPYVIGEPTIIRTASGKLVLLARSETGYRSSRGENWTQRGMLLQSDSSDDGQTWSELTPTSLSSMSSPGHLLQLQDGRVLCTHASRAYPGSIYVTVSTDECATWDTAHTKLITNDVQSVDSCYPTSGQRSDGTVVTTWYSNLLGRFYVPVLLWRTEQL